MKRSGVERKTPLRGRSEPLSRSKGLDRGNGRLARSSPETGGGGLSRRRRKRPPEGPLSPKAWAEEVFDLDDGLSRASGDRVPVSVLGSLSRDDVDLRYFHHPIPKQLLRRRKLYHLVWDPRNGILVLPDEHAAHEAALPRIPYDRLPARTIEFATELGDWAIAALLRYHPPAKEV